MTQVHPNSRPRDTYMNPPAPVGLRHVGDLPHRPAGWHRGARCAPRVAQGFDPWMAARNGYTAGERYGHDLMPAEKQAIACCMGCPVIEACLAESIDASVWRGYGSASSEYGVFGGTLPQERKRKTLADLPELLAFARERATRLGLAPKPVRRLVGRPRQRTCRAGHPLELAYVDARGKRHCRPCAAERARCSRNRVTTISSEVAA
jgi:hypothetical protein